MKNLLDMCWSCHLMILDNILALQSLTYYCYYTCNLFHSLEFYTQSQWNQLSSKSIAQITLSVFFLSTIPCKEVNLSKGFIILRRSLDTHLKIMEGFLNSCDNSVQWYKKYSSSVASYKLSGVAVINVNLHSQF